MARESYTAVRTDVKTWPQFLPFRQPVAAVRPSHHFVVAIFVSVAMHASILWIVATVRTAVEPTAPSISTPLIVSLVSLPKLSTASNDGPDREVVSAVQHTVPPSQPFQPSPEQKVKTEMVVATEGQEVLDSETSEDKSLVNEETPSIDLEDTYRVVQEVEKMLESEAGTVAASKVQGIPGSEAPAGKSLATDGISSFDLEASYKIAREVGKTSMSESETQELRFAQVTLNERNDQTESRAPRLNCKNVFKKRGLLVIPLAILNFGCEW